MRTPIPHPRRGLAAALVLCAAGCGAESRIAKPADPDRARQALQAALDAWKHGEEPDVLQGQSPPIHIADEEWLAGTRLHDYQATDPGRLVGNDLDCPVTLTLRDRRGRPLKKRVAYRVATHPMLSVVRLERP